MLGDADLNDYLTDEESDEGADFEVAMPGLDTLLEQFEKGDEAIAKHNETQVQFTRDEKSRGFEPPVRFEIVNKKSDKLKVLDDNISMQRQKQTSLIPSLITDLNE